MGGPGSGKATHCARLASKYGCVHLRIEKLMRSEVREETETGRAIAEMVKGGKIVPAHLHLTLLKHVGTKAGEKEAPLWPSLIKGHPEADMSQVKRAEKSLEDIMAELHEADPDGMNKVRSMKEGMGGDGSMM